MADTEKLIKTPENYSALAQSEPTGQEQDDLLPNRSWWRRFLIKYMRTTFLPRRYWVAIWAFLGFCNVYALRVNLSVAIVAMTTKHGDRDADFDWDPQTQGFILSTFFYGYICTQLPGGWLASRYGGKKVLGIGLLCTSVLSLLTPLVCKSGGVPGLVIVRILQGLAEGVVYPSMHVVWSSWAPASERSRLATITFSGSYAGTVIALPISGLIAQHNHWPTIFYAFGLVAFLWSIIWISTVGETPGEDKRITEDEVNYITSTLGPPTPTKPAPWRKMLTSAPAWAINVAHFSENWGFYTLLTLLPRYMKDIYKVDLSTSGFMSALPYLIMAIIVQTAGFLADYMRARFLSTTHVRKIFTCTAFASQTVFMIAAAYVTNSAWAYAFLTASVGLGGFAWAGFSVNHLDIAPAYAGLLMGISNTFATIPGMASPYLAGRIVQTGSAGEWREVFSVSATIYLIGAFIYGLLASGEQQRWAESISTLDLSGSIDSDLQTAYNQNQMQASESTTESSSSMSPSLSLVSPAVSTELRQEQMADRTKIR